MSDRRQLDRLDDDALDALLREADASIPVPDGLVDRIATRIETRRGLRRRRPLVLGLAAAALVTLTTIAWLLAPGRVATPPEQRVVRGGGDSGTAVTSPSVSGDESVVSGSVPRPARVEFDRDPTLFARELPSSDPRVTIHFVYRAVTGPASSTPGGDARSQS